MTSPLTHPQFYTGKPVSAKAEHYARVQHRREPPRHEGLSPGDGSPSGRQTRRFKLSTTHTIAKQILDPHPKSLIGLEDVTGIRERTNRRKRRAPRQAAGPGFPQSAEAQIDLPPRGRLPNSADC